MTRARAARVALSQLAKSSLGDSTARFSAGDRAFSAGTIAGRIAASYLSSVEPGDQLPRRSAWKCASTWSSWPMAECLAEAVDESAFCCGAWAIKPAPKPTPRNETCKASMPAEAAPPAWDSRRKRNSTLASRPRLSRSRVTPTPGTTASLGLGAGAGACGGAEAFPSLAGVTGGRTHADTRRFKALKTDPALRNCFWPVCACRGSVCAAAVGDGRLDMAFDGMRFGVLPPECLVAAPLQRTSDIAGRFCSSVIA